MIDKELNIEEKLIYLKHNIEQLELKTEHINDYLDKTIENLYKFTMRITIIAITITTVINLLSLFIINKIK